ncbi:hypothetical protein H5410_031770 [Solanum commersonii]|uniref:DUF4283 domain-containing protein n=1 Tax=Solanum commersonii TaxID=4109 RepID=A0A9J5YL34_SOLCO|nr:hypothetical protein H5410_031770 [Solanum commersonii]
MLRADDRPSLMDGLATASSSNFPPLPCKTQPTLPPQLPTSPCRNKYADIIRGHGANYKEKVDVAVDPIPMKKPHLTDGLPTIHWTAKEIQRMNIIENLQYAVVGKFSYGAPEINEIRKLIPKQCGIIRGCQIGYLRNRHILMRFDCIENYIRILFKNLYYIIAKDGYAYQMRPFIYDSNFKMQLENNDNQENLVVKIKIQYDSVPAYCKQCKLQGHAEDDCRVLHPELVQQHNEDRPKESQHIDNKQLYKGAIKSKWRPTNRTFTKRTGEIMNVKIMESAQVTSNINPFNVLNQQNQNEEEAIEVGASNKMQQGGELINKVNLPKSQTNKKEVALEEADMEDGEIAENKVEEKEVDDVEVVLNTTISETNGVNKEEERDDGVSGEQQVAKFIENGATEDKDEIDSLQPDNIVFKEARLTPSTSSKLKALMAPFQRTNNIQRYKRRLGMEYANHNCKGKIWVFIYDQFQVEVLSDSEQMLTLSLKFLENNQLFAVSMVYAKCDAEERLNLWNDIYCICNDINNSPWLTGGILMSL